jgi:hypothetical protein
VVGGGGPGSAYEPRPKQGLADGGVGTGAGVNTLTLGPGCAAVPPTGCIPAKGESISVTLYTLKQGSVLAPSPFQYTYTAASPSP